MASFGRVEGSLRWTCGVHLQEAIDALGVPSTVLDWQGAVAGVPDLLDIFDIGAVAAELDAALASSFACEIDEHLARFSGPVVLGVLLGLTATPGAWPKPVEGVWNPPAGQRGAKQIWGLRIPRRSEPYETVVVPMCSQPDRLPLGLLRAILPVLKNPRSASLVGDVLWCVTGEREFAQLALTAHTECALNFSIGDAMAPSTPVRVGVSADELAIDQRRPAAQFRIAHLGRAIAIAQLFNKVAELADLHSAVQRELCDADHNGLSVTGILERAAPPARNPPQWWDKAADTELARIMGSDCPIQAGLQGHIELMIERARARRDASAVQGLYRKLVYGFWASCEGSDRGGGVSREWARQAHEIASKYVHDLIHEARVRSAAIDPMLGVEPTTFTAEMGQMEIDYRAAIIKCVDFLPDSFDRLMFLAQLSGLTERFVQKADISGSSPLLAMIRRVTHGRLERVAASEDDRIAGMRTDALSLDLTIEVQAYLGAAFQRIIELHQPETPPTVGSGFLDLVAMTRIHRGLELCNQSDFDTAAHLLTPTAERVVKNILRTTGVRPIVPANSDGGTSNPGTLGELLSKLGGVPGFAPSIGAALQFLLVAEVVQVDDDDPARAIPKVFGLNLRNDVCHGEGESAFNADACFQLLLAVGVLLRACPHADEVRWTVFDLRALMDAAGVDNAAQFWGPRPK